MKKTVKILAGVLGIILLILVAAAILIPIFIDPNDYKDEIAAAVKQQTGRELNIAGDLKLSVFPWLGVSIGAVELGNAPGFGTDPFARIEAADVKVKLVPLLSSQVEVSTITLRGATVNLAKDKSGKGNWEDLAGGPAPAAAPEKPAEAGPGAAEAAKALAALAIGGVQLTDAKITWFDATTNARQQVDGLGLTTGAIKLGEPVDLHLAFDLKSNQPPATGRVELDTRLAVDLLKEQHRLDNTQLRIKFNVEQPATEGTLTLTTQGFVDMANDRLDLKDLVIRAAVNGKEPALSTDAELSTQVRVGIKSQQIAVAPFKLRVTNKGEVIPGGEAQTEITSKIDADLKKQTLRVAELAISSLGLALSGEINGTKIIDAPQLVGKLNLAPFSPRELLAKMKQPAPETADKNVLNKADLALDFKFMPDSFDVTRMVAHLDNTALTSVATVKNFAKPAVFFDVGVDSIDVDRYLPPKKEGETKTATPAEAAAAGATQIPVETLRTLNIDGKASVGHLKVTNLKVDEFLAKISAKDGLIQIHPLQAKLYGGTYTGNVQADARGAKLKLSLDEQLNGIQSAPLLKDMIGDDKLSGKGSVVIKLGVEGNDPDAMLASVTGLTKLSFADGAIKGFNINNMIRRARAAFKNEAPPPEDQVEKTDFASLDTTLNFDKGTIKNDDLSLKSPFLRVTGAGQAGLVAQDVDYVLTATIVGTSKGQVGKELEELKGVPIAVKVSGKMVDPKFKIDIAQAFKDKAKGEAKAKVEEKKQEVKEKTEKKLKEKFEKFLQ